MQGIRTSLLGYLRVRASIKKKCLPAEYVNPSNMLCRQMCADSTTSYDEIMHKVIGIVKKYDRIDSTKVSKYGLRNSFYKIKQVTETADFQKDLSLDSLDRVELVMAFEQEFSIEIPDEKADKLSCCAEVAKYILSRVKQNNVES